MADLALPTEYKHIKYGNHFPDYMIYNPHNSRKSHGKIRPNYEVVKGHKQHFVRHGYDYFDIPYSQYKEEMIDIVKQLEGTQFRGMIVNRGGHPKTNTIETRYKHLRRMIKDGCLKMEKRRIYGYRTVSVLVTVK